MVKLILVRHGKTLCNEKGALSGLTDSVLSERGMLNSPRQFLCIFLVNSLCL